MCLVEENAEVLRFDINFLSYCVSFSKLNY